MSYFSSGKPIINLLYEFDLVFSFDQKGDPVFELMKDGKPVGNDITIETHTATLIFTLKAPDMKNVVWATNFQWLNPLTRAPVLKPSNIAFIRDNDSVVTMIDSNPVSEEGDEQRMHFLFSVLKVVLGQDAIMYTSPDPVIINKKPPE